MTHPRVEYSGNTDAAGVARRFKESRSAVIVTHSKPDGDAAGAVVATARLLSLLGVNARAWLVGPFPSWLDTVASGIEVTRLAPQAAPPAIEPDLIVIVDTGSWMQLDQLAPWLRTRADRAVIIDHHLHGDPDAAKARLVDPAAASCTEVLSGVVDAALNLQGAAPIPRAIAEPLYLGLATDTGWFKFSNVRPATLRLAARLLEAGIDAPSLYELTEQQDRPGRLGLLGRALAGHTLHDLPAPGGGRVCVMSLRQADFKQCGVEGEDVGSFSQHALAVAGVNVCAVFSEQSPPGSDTPVTKVSLRSKPGPHAVDVAAACDSLGGGGHARAAGVKLSMPLDQARAAMLKALGAKA